MGHCRADIKISFKGRAGTLNKKIQPSILFNLIKTCIVCVGITLSGTPAPAWGQNIFYGTPNRGVEGGKGNAQLKLLLDENTLRRNETTQNATDVTGLDNRLDVVEGEISDLNTSVAGHTATLNTHGTRVGTLETTVATVKNHAKVAMPGTCHNINAKLRWNTTTTAWECITEGDPKIGTLTNDKWCKVVSGKIVCNQNSPIGGTACAGQTVKWGSICSKAIPNKAHGQAVNASISCDGNKQGSAIFVCHDGRWIVGSHSCVSCDNGPGGGGGF